MATHLDLEEQEQLDAVKHFWKRYGNLITWLLILVLGGYAAWNGWNWWQLQRHATSARLNLLAERAEQRQIPERTRVACLDPALGFDVGDRFAASDHRSIDPALGHLPGVVKRQPPPQRRPCAVIGQQARRAF